MQARNLPTGDVTFAFTDIEGSTQMLRRIGPDRYTEVLDRHDVLLRRCWERHGGVEVGNEGDSFLVAFHEPSSAWLASCDAQLALASEHWQPDAEIRVRMGLHRGLARPRGTSYTSLAVHQASRVMTAASGRQIFATAEVVTGLKSDVGPSSHSLGRYRVRDFDDPIELFTVDDDRWPASPAPPRVPAAEGHNLVAPRISLVGRDAELDQLPSLLVPGALVTLAGPGGAGKTRLATEVGIRVAPSWPDGVWMAALDQATSYDAMVGVVVDAVGAPRNGDDDPLAVLEAYCRQRQLLIVLDNCEHILDHVRQLVVRLRATSPGTALLLTSRSPLGLTDERVWRVATLATSAPEGGIAPAVQLFNDRIQLGDPALVDGRSRDLAVSLCAKLDGLPLAIEIAAANAHRMPVETLIARLDAGAALPARSDPDVADRHRSLDAALEWGHGLLDPVSRSVLEAVCDLPGGFDLDAAGAAVGGQLAPDEVAFATWSLVDDSLVQPDRSSGADRYRVLAVVRSFVAQRVAPDRRAATMAQLARHFLDRLGPEHPPDRQWTSALGAELDNLRYLAATPSDASINERQTLAWLVGRHVDLTDRFASGASELGALAAELSEPTPELVAVRTLIADLHLRCGDLAAAELAVEAVEAMVATVGTASWDDASLVRLKGDIALRRGSVGEALALADDAIAAGLSPRGEARIWNLIGLAHAGADAYTEARTAFDAELRLWQRLGFDAPQATTLGNLAEVALRAGDERAAARYQLGCLDLAVELGQPVTSAFSIVVAARLAARHGRAATAAQLQGSADAALSTLGYVLYDSDLAERTAMLDDVERVLGAETLAAELERGASVDVATALDEAADLLRSLA